MPKGQRRTIRIVFLAGDVSADILGALLIKSLKNHCRLEAFGIGGPKMEAQGLKALMSFESFRLFGFGMLLPHRLCQLFFLTLPALIRSCCAVRPTAVVTIDSSVFARLCVRRLQGSFRPHIHVVSPTVWFWRRRRLKHFAALYDAVLCFYPFEPAFLQQHRVNGIFTGHPLVGTKMLRESRGTHFRKTHGLAGTRPVVGLFFGSRRREISKNGQNLCETARLLSTRRSDIAVVASAAPNMMGEVRNLTEQLSVPVIYAEEQEKYAAMKACNAALAVSGTVHLELASCRVPLVVTYAVSPVEKRIFLALKGLGLLHGKYTTILNHMTGAETIPEMTELHHPDFSARDCADEVERLLDREQAGRQIQALEAAVDSLIPGDGRPAELHMAEEILRQIRIRTGRGDKASGERKKGTG